MIPALPLSPASPVVSRRALSESGSESTPGQVVSQPLETWFWPSLPWYSAPNAPFPKRRRKRRKRQEDARNEGDSMAIPKENAKETATGPPPSTTPTTPMEATQALPKSWSGLFQAPKDQNGIVRKQVIANGDIDSISTLIRSWNVTQGPRELVEPRGLVNTGNMCFMNAILQVLLFCGPFHSLLRHTGQHIAHSFDSSTPLLDAMILYFSEFRTTTDPMRYGDPLVPEFIYQAMRGNKSFDTMQHGRQEDAQEFLGFLLDGLHEEFSSLMKGSSASSPSMEDVDGWEEIGTKGRIRTTRAAAVQESPITSIFGGTIKSVLRVSGRKESATTEPFQPLQLDIQSKKVSTILDAIRQITEPETLHGDFKSRGIEVSATKQVFIQSLPPVLILHLKRFSYDEVGGTQKSWKKVGYPLEFTFPSDVMFTGQQGYQYRLFAG